MRNTDSDAHSTKSSSHVQTNSHIDLSRLTVRDGLNGSVAERTFTLVVSRYHGQITGNLLTGAIETLRQHDVPDENIRLVWVPGAWEIPFALQRSLQQFPTDAAICLGCVIRGETTHDQYINQAVSDSLSRLGLERDLPIAFGLLTCQTIAQAEARAGGAVGNKGIECAEAVIELLRLCDRL